jgi:hypothetical protein
MLTQKIQSDLENIVELEDWKESSGGGFTGRCGGSVLNTNIDLQDEKSPFRPKLCIEESETMRYLRNSSRYLAPGVFVSL